MANHAYTQIAANHDLWREYVDPSCSLADFNDTSLADKIALQIQVFGPEIKIPTVDEVLDATHTSNGFHDFAVEGGSITVQTEALRKVLEAAYDSSNPDWVALVSEDDFAE